MGIGSSPFRGFGRREPPAVVSQIDGLEPYLPDGPYENEKKKSLHGDDVEDMDLLIDELESEAGEFEEVEISDDSQSVVPDEFLRTDSITGLSDGEVSIRRKKYGPNKMKEEKENHFLKFLSFFVGPIQFVMEVRCPRFSPSYMPCALTNTQKAAAVLAAGLRDWVDFGVICALLVLNAAVGFVQEYQAGSIVDELKKTLALRATIVRNGTSNEFDASEVVPGDILKIDEVWHDCRTEYSAGLANTY